MCNLISVECSLSSSGKCRKQGVVDCNGKNDSNIDNWHTNNNRTNNNRTK